MENLLFIVLIVVLLALLVGIGVMAWLGHRFLKLKEEERGRERQAKESQESIFNLKQDPKLDPKLDPKDAHSQRQKQRLSVGADILKALRSQQGKSLYCQDHPDIISVGQCAISGESCCDHCLTKQKDIKVAKKYLDLYLDSEWVEVAMLANQEISQDAAQRIIKVKEVLWQDQSMPMIVQGHFKINVQSDEIEAFTVIIARRDDSEFIKKELSFTQMK